MFPAFTLSLLVVRMILLLVLVVVAKWLVKVLDLPPKAANVIWLLITICALLSVFDFLGFIKFF